MRSHRILVATITALAGLTAALSVSIDRAHAENWVGRSISLAGRNMQCGQAEIMIDRDLPSEGGAGDDFLILNPDMLAQQPKTVRVFVFAHECGHLTVGDSELAADCFAVNRGVREHWLDRKGLDQVCDSFEGAPATDTHPSAARRCRNLNRCFADAMKSQMAGKERAPDLPIQKRVAEREHKAVSAWRCAPASTETKDAIGNLISKDGQNAQACR